MSGRNSDTIVKLEARIDTLEWQLEFANTCTAQDHQRIAELEAMLEELAEMLDEDGYVGFAIKVATLLAKGNK